MAFIRRMKAANIYMYTKKYHFSSKLKRRLNQISHYPLTIVEAPPGFGKTTAIREYLSENIPQSACVYWYTCLGEPASIAWHGICTLIANVNGKIAASLKVLEMPIIDTLPNIALILRNIQCKSETYLVIDNYQLVNCDIPRELMNAFSMHGSSDLHMIFITQQLRTNIQFSIHNDMINFIDSSAFFIDMEGTDSLFRMEGIRLTNEELNSVCLNTEGWVSAIRLQIIHYKEAGSLEKSADIEHLVKTSIWSRLSTEERNFLLSVSILDSFTAPQAAIMLNKDVLPESIEDLLNSNDFIRYFPDQGMYTIHSILQEFLRNRFYNHQSEHHQKQMLNLAGYSCSAISQYYSAAQYFYKIKNFDAIFSLPFDIHYLGKYKEKDILIFLKEVVKEGPEETLCKYPVFLLTLAYFMLWEGQSEAFQKLYHLIGSAIDNHYDMNQDELKQLKGEFALLNSFIENNCIGKMNVCLKAAHELLGGPSNIINSSVGIPWSFGNISYLTMYWRESGKLDEELDEMDECSAYYRKLTRDHCAGANNIMRAEAMLMRGEDEQAEILCHKALHEARKFKQISICLYADLLLARIAILRQDAKSYFSAVRNIQSYTTEKESIYIRRMAELCLSSLNLELGFNENIAQWLNDLESISKIMYSHSSFPAFILYAKNLLKEKRYNEFFGISQFLTDTVGKTTPNAEFLMPHVYRNMFLAVAKYNCGEALVAKAYLKEALNIALPDKIYLPFAQQEGLYETLLDSTMGISIHPAVCFTDAYPKQHTDRIPSNDEIQKLAVNENEKRLAALKALCRRHSKGVNYIRKAILKAKSPLSQREREVARLSQERLSVKEIAEKLYISESTVRTIQRNLYRKLDIHTKSELYVIEL